MSQITEHIDVDVPVERSYEYWAQFENFPHILPYVEKITRRDDTHHHWVVSVHGQQREFDTEVTEHIPNERIAWKSVGGQEDQAGVVTFHRLSDSTSRATVQLDWTPEGFTEKIGAALGIDNRSVRNALEKFKQEVEKVAGDPQDVDPDIAAG